MIKTNSKILFLALYLFTTPERQK